MSPDNLDRRLRRIKGHIIPGLHGVPGQKSSGKPALASRYKKMAERFGGELMSVHGGSFCRITKLYPFGSSFGGKVLEPPDKSWRVPMASFAAGEVQGMVDPADLLFFDLETTGLGGAGTVPFLIGCGSLCADGFEVRQYLLPDYPDETAMLEHLLSELTTEKTIVSYNGAAFDLNLIRDRMIINRVAREVPLAGHIDLLHATRRLFKRRLRDCSLGNVEREVFDFHRTDDIPGYLVPAVYFDWLASEELSAMAAVLEHNRQDILTLWYLLLHIANIFSSAGDSLDHTQDIHSLARVYGRRRDNDKVVSLYDRLNELKDDSNSSLEEDVLLYHSFAFKRSGDWSRAVELWYKLVDCCSREGFQANLELAKFYEHRQKDFKKAVVHARAAEKSCPSTGRHRLDLLKRQNRLESKLESQRS